MMKKIKVDIVSDSVCPWCYVGIKSLEQAIKKLDGQFEFELEWHPFQLNPGMSDEGIEYQLYLETILGNRTNEARKAVKDRGAEVGIDFKFEKIKRVSNTLRSHYLVALAKNENKQTQTVKALFQAYFENGMDINTVTNLNEIGSSIGLSEKSIAKLDAIKEEDLLPIVKQEEGFRELGITSVPSFIFESQYLVQGAQDAEVFMDVIRKIQNPEKESSCGCGSEGCS